MKISTIQTLLDEHFITLEECDKSEKETNDNVVKKTEDGKYYKVKETEDEIKMDLLANMAADIKTIKRIIIFSLCAAVIIIAILYAAMSASH